jgi:uncharacterized repeat protein (TIGR02543 family)
MRKWGYRRVIAALLAAVMVMGMSTDSGAALAAARESADSTAAVSELSLMTGILRAQPMELDLDKFEGSRYEASELAESRQESQTVSGMKASQVYTDDWDCYSTNYYYNLLDDDQREFWDALDVMCLNYMKKKTDMTAYNGYYLTDYVYTAKLTDDDAMLVTQIFRYSNPQYYFLEPLFFYRMTSKSVGISMVVYDAFGDGDDRAAATKKFKKAVESWTAKVSGYGTDYEKVRAIHDLICNNTTYNYDVLDMFGTVSASDEQEAMTQSAYSTFILGTTVCAGYAQACELLCNAVGVDAIVVTSADHEWNKVRMEDSWYNVDCTWDDQGNAIYEFFAKSDYAYNNELRLSSSHQVESVWTSYLPDCTLDSGSTYYEAGTLPAVTETTADVAIRLEPVYEQDKTTGTEYIKTYKVTMSCDTKGAVIYYTTDGTTPTPAAGKAKKYKKSFKLNDVSKLSAVAVCDGKYDSGVTFSDSVEPVSYKIKYVLNGGTNSEKNPNYYNSDSTVKLKKPTRKGYTFSGWYTTKEFDSAKVTQIGQGTTGAVTLYAKWTPVTYKVKFAGNGADSGSVSAQKYKYGKSYKLPANTFKRKGYTFAGWNTKKDGSGTSYGNRKSVKNLTSKSGKTVTLYAQWKKNK